MTPEEIYNHPDFFYCKTCGKKVDKVFIYGPDVDERIPYVVILFNKEVSPKAYISEEDIEYLKNEFYDVDLIKKEAETKAIKNIDIMSCYKCKGDVWIWSVFYE